MNSISSSNEVKLELNIPGSYIPNNIRLIDGNLTLDELEKKVCMVIMH